jgi:tRNA dimethylallyltransferase
LRSQLEAAGPAALRRRLEAIDPVAAQRIHPNDRKRTIRAVEVYELTGRRISAMQRQWHRGDPRRDVRIIGLDYSVEVINTRINARVRAMIADGLVDEVRGLARPGALGRQAAEALGYRQILDHLAGRLSLDEAIEQIKIRTRRFARQQRTWLRRFRAHPQAAWIPADGRSPQELVEESLAVIRRPPKRRPAGPCDECKDEGISERLS